jgi:hypothetical protein
MPQLPAKVNRPQLQNRKIGKVQNQTLPPFYVPWYFVCKFQMISLLSRNQMWDVQSDTLTWVNLNVGCPVWYADCQRIRLDIPHLGLPMSVYQTGHPTFRFTHVSVSDWTSQWDVQSDTLTWVNLNEPDANWWYPCEVCSMSTCIAWLWILYNNTKV